MIVFNEQAKESSVQETAFVIPHECNTSMALAYFLFYFPSYAIGAVQKNKNIEKKGDK